MHKRGPLLRPRKKNDGSTLNSNTSTNSRNNKKIHKKTPLFWLFALVSVIGVYLYIQKVNQILAKRDLNQKEQNSSTLKKDFTSIKSQSKTTKKNDQVGKKVKDIAANTSKTIDQVHGNKSSDYEHPDYHLIFSTDCSAFQHWQSYLMFHSAYKVNQPGTITRIASGCSDEEAEIEKKWHEEHVTNVMGDRFKLHLTPHFSKIKNEEGKIVGDYKFFNKPFGLLHWLEHAMGFKDETTKVLNNLDDVVMLIDPDMILLKPITGDFSNDDDVVIGPRHKKERKYFVKHGAPFAQKYGLGTQWRTFDLDAIAGADSPAKLVSQSDGGTFYPVGPPYIGTVGDMYQIALKWTEFVPLVHKQYPYLLAEMYAFCIAAAHLGLKHQLIDSLMISNVNVGGEGWPMIDNITTDTVPSLCEYASQADHGDHPVPSVIHYCQRYAIGDWFFGKKKMVKNFFECDQPMMEFPPLDIIETSDYKHIFNDKKKDFPSKEIQRREGFMVCGVMGALNDASTFFKKNSCKGVEANMEMKTNLNKK